MTNCKEALEYYSRKKKEAEKMDREQAFNILRGITLASGLDNNDKRELLEFINKLEIEKSEVEQ